MDQHARAADPFERGALLADFNIRQPGEFVVGVDILEGVWAQYELYVREMSCQPHGNFKHRPVGLAGVNNKLARECPRKSCMHHRILLAG